MKGERGIDILTMIAKFLTVFLWMLLFTVPQPAFAQDEEEAEESFQEASIEISFAQTDTTKTLIAIVKSDTVPVEGVEVYFYVERLFRMMSLNIGTETDENGMASVEFPMDLMGDENGMLQVVARLEEDDTYGDVESRAKVKWGVPFVKELEDHWSERSMSASREKAPMYLIVASNVIIAVIWGTIFYIIWLVFRIRKIGRAKKSV